MKKERDLLPWIFGGLSSAAIAVAFAAVSTHRAVPTLVPQVVAAQPAALPPSLPAAATAQAAPQAAPPATEPNSAPPAQAQTAVEPEAQAGQIWACMAKGVKTFSNNPCAEKSTLLDVGPINTMSPTPAMHYARAYGPEPRYASGYTDQSAAADAEEYSDQNAADTGESSYAIVHGVGFVSRRRPEHIHRPPPPTSHQNPGPVRRY